MHNTLLVDLDPKADLTKAMDLEPGRGYFGIGDVLRGKPLTHAIAKLENGIDLVRSSDHLAEATLIHPIDGFFRLKTPC